MLIFQIPRGTPRVKKTTFFRRKFRKSCKKVKSSTNVHIQQKVDNPCIKFSG